jgi:hypothetical protein
MKTDHQGPGYFKAIPVPPDGHVPGRFVAYRQLDEVRPAALHEAIGYASSSARVASPDDILQWAELFEAWLAGPEAA